jgi:hypothetical protein
VKEEEEEGKTKRESEREREREWERERESADDLGEHVKSNFYYYPNSRSSRVIIRKRETLVSVRLHTPFLQRRRRSILPFYATYII